MAQTIIKYDDKTATAGARVRVYQRLLHAQGIKHIIHHSPVGTHPDWHGECFMFSFDPYDKEPPCQKP